MESFFSSLKTERLARKIYRTRDAVWAEVFDYIERFYNPTRRHLAIGYLGGRTPEEFAGYSARAKDRAEGAALLESSAPSGRSTTAPTRGKRRPGPSYPRGRNAGSTSLRPNLLQRYYPRRHHHIPPRAMSPEPGRAK
jgi:hypothetical protein